MAHVRNIHGLIGTLFLATLLLMGGGAILMFSPTSGSSADFEITPSAIDLGTVHQGRKVTYTFTIRKTTHMSIQYIAVDKSCDCMLLEDISAADVDAGGLVSVNGEIDTYGRRGAVESLIILRYRLGSSRTEQSAIVRIRATVLPAITFKPDPVVFKIKPTDEGAVTGLVSLESTRSGRLAINDVSSDASWMRGVVQPLAPDAPDTSPTKARIQIYIDMDQLRGDTESAQGTSHHTLKVFTDSETENVLVLPIDVVLEKQSATRLEEGRQ